MDPRRALPHFLVVLSCLLPTALRAQPGGGTSLTGTLDAGAARVRQGGLLRGDAMTVGGSVRLGQGATSVTVSTMASHAENAFGESRWAGVGALALAGWLRPASGLRLELSAEGQAIAPGGVRATRSALGGARLYREGAHGRWSWVGLGGGAADDPDSHRHAAIAEVGLLQPVGPWRFSVGSTVVDTKTGLVSVARPEEWVSVTQPLTYVEPTAGARVTWGVLEAGADAGLRLVTRGARPSLAPPPARRLPWMVLSGGWRVMPHVAVIVSGGRALEDPVRGMPATRYASAALRVSLGRERSTAGTPREAPLPATVVLRDGARVLRVHAPGATRVEVMGTMTDWAPVALQPGDGAWELVLPGPAGSAHRLVVRVDGGRWRAPTNLPTASDDFGGTVGLLTVP